MPVDAPSSGPITKVIHDPLQWLEGSVAIIGCNIYPGVSEANNVRTAITQYIGQETLVPVDTPSPGVVAKVIDNQLYRLEGSVAVVGRDIHPGVAESNNVWEAIAHHIG